jgi:hypothetical protein
MDIIIISFGVKNKNKKNNHSQNMKLAGLFVTFDNVHIQKGG